MALYTTVKGNRYSVTLNAAALSATSYRLQAIGYCGSAAAASPSAACVVVGTCSCSR